ncbi:hypothetical protein M422DRAFT_253198 [Sphaerobolus stellatus SS14]|uniref:Uncharacterized protein n=1 Tax=Sphaerobolus stellatus (strain SS14) TaxID=990650 RepID=A0A0C9VNL1_SPHS4|nr:hypothetical protein M422DRAFT_253198 [Sphaerobolus stellatus SS14]
MAPGKKVSKDLTWTIIHMSSMLPLDDISAYTELSIWKIRAIRALHSKAREVVKHKAREVREKALRVDDVNLMLGCLHQTCDYYLDELQQALFNGHNVKASIATIWWALRNSGYTMKRMDRCGRDRPHIRGKSLKHQI